MNNKISILHLEDFEEDSILVKSLIRKEITSFDFYFVENEADFIKALEEKKIDIILSDYHLPGYSGSDALLVVKNKYPHIPFIFVTGKMGEDAAIESLLNGATDYVLKSKMERLVPAIKRVLYEAKLIQERKQAEEDLLLKTILLETQSETSIDGILAVDTEGHVILFNKRFGELCNIPQQLLNQKEEKKMLEYVLTQLKDPEEFGRQVGYLYEHKDEKSRDEIEFRDGRCFDRYSSPMISSDGKYLGRIWFFRDITERKRTEGQLLKAKEKAEAGDRLKTAFIRNISHEIRTPLNGILGFGQMMTDPDLSRKEKDELLILLNESSDRLINTMTNIMDISLIVSGNQEVKKKIIAPGLLLDEIHHAFIQRCIIKKLTLSIQKQTVADELILNTDPELLSKVLNHLVDNAIKFTTRGSITVGCKVMDNEVEFFVKDSGIGINLIDQKNIFDYFIQEDVSNTRYHEGNGLGLSIAKGLTELLGGRIWIESIKDEGSVFRFTIPVF